MDKQEPKQIVYISKSGDCWFVWLNTRNDSRLENGFESYKEAESFAQAWANGIKAMHNVECEVMLTRSSIVDEDLELDVKAAADFADTLTPFVNALMPLIQLFSKEVPRFIDGTVVFKRLYLGSTYAYNLLSRCRFLVKSPKTVSRISGIVIWIFVHLPKWFILRWPMPDLRD